MRNFLLSVGLVSLCAFGVEASEVTLEMASATDIQGDWVDTVLKDDGSVQAYEHYDNVTSLKLGDYLFELTTAEGSNANAYYKAADAAAYTLRVYRGNSVTITAPAGEPMGTIQLTCTTVKAVSDQNPIIASVGGVSYDNKVITWTNSEAVEAVTLTLPSDKQGSDNPQIRICEVSISSDTGTVPGPVEPTEGVKFNLASSIESGQKYVIVADGHIASPVPADKKYGYLQIGECTVEGITVTAVADYAFTLEASGAGYTIRQADGRYLYQTGNYNSFNVSEDIVEGCMWSVEIAEDGVATIKNESVGKTIQYDGQYNSYGSYEDIRATLPSLYLMADDSLVESIESVQTSEAVYYDINGRRVNGMPERGLYIKIADGVAAKVMIK
ncbi:MAG: hypothetical protein K2H47_06135 [Muribaculaceae bacterium]|nr:hypothetical protein [Muribaculaceae bacterium]